MEGTHLVRLTGKEHGSVADTESALLLLALLVNLRDGPSLYGACLRFCLALAD